MLRERNHVITIDSNKVAAIVGERIKAQADAVAA
jgi:hypothetical protein